MSRHHVQSSEERERMIMATTEMEGASYDFHTPYFADLRDSITLGALRWCQNDFFGALDLIVAKQPRGGALNNVAVVALADGLKHAGDLGLGRSLLGSSLGLFLIAALSQKTRRDHQSQEELIAVVGRQHQVGWTTGNLLASLVLGGGEDSIAHNGAEAIDLSTELDLDGLAGLDFSGSLGLVGRQRGVGGDVGGGRDGGRVGEALSFGQRMWSKVYK